MRLVLASRNPNKLVELRALCGLADSFLVSAAECPGAPDPEEDGATFVENALIKARALRDFSGEWALADDSGLEVDALGGAPGVRSARYAGEHGRDGDNNALLAYAGALATSPFDELRDGKLALKLAERGSSQLRDNDPYALTVVAAARAENGDFRKAADISRKAAVLYEKNGDSVKAAAQAQRIALFEKGMPFRDE